MVIYPIVILDYRFAVLDENNQMAEEFGALIGMKVSLGALGKS